MVYWGSDVVVWCVVVVWSFSIIIPLLKMSLGVLNGPEGSCELNLHRASQKSSRVLKANEEFFCV